VLRERVLTALLLAAALLTILVALPEDVGVVLFGMLMLMGAWEWAGLATLRRPVARALYTLAVALVIGLLAWRIPVRLMPPQLLWAQVLAWAVAGAYLYRFPVRIPPMAVGVGGLLVLPLAWMALSYLLKSRLLGPEWVLLLFLVVAAADIGAFFAGRRFGRVRLAPRVSPGKTWEGLLGGLALVAFVAIAWAWWLDSPLPWLLSLTLSVAGISVLGDLTISMLKRNVGLKDSGQIFPGHGGVLDRIDSLLAAAPLFVLGLLWQQAP
jgi:phosphatidate cytidylyltransferase